MPGTPTLHLPARTVGLPDPAGLGQIGADRDAPLGLGFDYIPDPAAAGTTDIRQIRPGTGGLRVQSLAVTRSYVFAGVQGSNQVDRWPRDPATGVISPDGTGDEATRVRLPGLAAGSLITAMCGLTDAADGTPRVAVVNTARADTDGVVDIEARGLTFQTLSTLFSVPALPFFRIQSLRGIAASDDESLWYFIAVDKTVRVHNSDGTAASGAPAFDLSGFSGNGSCIAVSADTIWFGVQGWLRAFNRLTGARLAVSDVNFGTAGLGDTDGGADAVDGWLYAWTTTSQVERWRFVGNALSGWSVRRSTDGGSAWQHWNGAGWVASATAAGVQRPTSELTADGETARGHDRYRVDLPASWDSGNNEHLIQVRNRDAGSWSAWSASKRVLPDALPSLALTHPAAGGDLSERDIIDWSVANQGFYRVTIAAAGVVLVDSGWVASAATQHQWGSRAGRPATDQVLWDLDPAPAEGSDLSVAVMVSTARFLTVDAERAAVLRYTPPGRPLLGLTVDDDAASVLAQWALAAQTAQSPATVRVELWRRLVGDAGQGLRLVNSTAVAVLRHLDRWCPLETDVEYRLLAFGSFEQTDRDTPWIEHGRLPPPGPAQPALTGFSATSAALTATLSDISASTTVYFRYRLGAGPWTAASVSVDAGASSAVHNLPAGLAAGDYSAEASLAVDYSGARSASFTKAPAVTPTLTALAATSSELTATLSDVADGTTVYFRYRLGVASWTNGSASSSGNSAVFNLPSSLEAGDYSAEASLAADYSGAQAASFTVAATVPAGRHIFTVTAGASGGVIGYWDGNTGSITSASYDPGDGSGNVVIRQVMRGNPVGAADLRFLINRAGLTTSDTEVFPDSITIQTDGTSYPFIRKAVPEIAAFGQGIGMDYRYGGSTPADIVDSLQDGKTSTVALVYT